MKKIYIPSNLHLSINTLLLLQLNSIKTYNHILLLQNYTVTSKKYFLHQLLNNTLTISTV